MKPINSWSRRAIALGAVTLVAAGGVAMTASSASAKHQTSFTVIASGLDNPRGLALAGDGLLYVAETGLGSGNGAIGTQDGYGTTGGLTAISGPRSKTPHQTRVLSGLSSIGDQGDAVGLDGLSFSNGKLYGIFSTSAPFGNLGQLVQFQCTNALHTPSNCAPLPTSRVVPIANVGAFNWGWTDTYKNEPWAPPGQFPDSNPYGVLVSNGHRYVVDAGANTLNEIDGKGGVHVLAYFPQTPVSDAIPTCVTRGPDGVLYIGTLHLGDFFVNGPGQATIYRVDPKKTVADDLPTILSVATEWATGLNTITGCAFDNRGHIDVVEMFTGQVVQVSVKNPSGPRNIIGGEGQLIFPNGIAVASDGTIYVSDHSSNGPAEGRVVRIRV